MPPPREAPAQTLPPTIFGQHLLLSAVVFAPRLRLAMLPTTHNPTTARFQLAIPSLLASISPSLSALHATRAHSLYPADAALAGTHCVRCGYPLIPSNSHTRSIRKKGKRSHGQSTIVRALRRSCRNCGHDEDVPVAVADAFMAFPIPRDRAKRQSSNIIQPRACIAATPPPDSLVPGPSQPRSLQPVASPVPSRPVSSPAPAPVTPNTLATRHSSAGSSPAQQDHTRARSRPKKKIGLQSMLARNRERQEQEKKREGSHNHGLSAFLQGL
ncbi:hypothetical protein C8Q74DRAFT_1368754 [Fomes fomentarius]|nr:hypothetical protein C8Q74DRAFT_1368754 [Fomes fomentarius]